MSFNLCAGSAARGIELITGSRLALNREPLSPYRCLALRGEQCGQGFGESDRGH
jgi:hypothetical protein